MYPKWTVLLLFVLLLVGSTADVKAQTLQADTTTQRVLDSSGRVWQWQTDVRYFQGGKSSGYLDTALHKPHLLPQEHRFVSLLSTYEALKQDGTIWGLPYHAWRVETPTGPLVPGDSIKPYDDRRLSSAAPQRWKDVFFGASYNLGVSQDDTLWWWGKVVGNQYSNMPVPAPLKGAVSSPIQVSWTACAIQNSDRSIWCWGGRSEAHGTDEKADDKNTPVKVKASGRFTKLVNSNGAACALREDNTVWCWGSNGSAGLGLGMPESWFKPGEKAKYGIDPATHEGAPDRVISPVQRPGRYAFLGSGGVSLDMQGAIWVPGVKGMIKIPGTQNFTEVSLCGAGCLLARHKDDSVWQLNRTSGSSGRYRWWDEYVIENSDFKLTRVDIPNP